jgi:hypothetical protein
MRDCNFIVRRRREIPCKGRTVILQSDLESCCQLISRRVLGDLTHHSSAVHASGLLRGIIPVMFVSSQVESRSAGGWIEISHSHRSAVTGSTLAARRAGSQPASTVIVLTTRRAMAKDIGSIASTANS